MVGRKFINDSPVGNGRLESDGGSHHVDRGKGGAPAPGRRVVRVDDHQGVLKNELFKEIPSTVTVFVAKEDGVGIGISAEENVEVIGMSIFESFVEKGKVEVDVAIDRQEECPGEVIPPVPEDSGHIPVADEGYRPGEDIVGINKSGTAVFGKEVCLITSRVNKFISVNIRFLKTEKRGGCII